MTSGDGNDLEVGVEMCRMTVKLEYGGKCKLVTLYAPVRKEIQALHWGYP